LTHTLSTTDVEQTIQADVVLAVTENAQTFAAVFTTPTSDIRATTFVRITQTQIAEENALIPEADLQITMSERLFFHSNVLPRTERVRAQVENRGTSAVGEFDVILFLGDEEVYRTTFDGLGPGEATSTGSVEVEFTEFGGFRLRAVVDSENLIPETDEDNNEATSDISFTPASWTPTPGADVDLTLAVNGDQTIEFIGPSATGLYNVQVQNIGTGRSTAFEVALYLNDEEVDRFSLAALQAGELIEIAEIPIEFIEAGGFEIRAVVDPDGVIAELDEDNNADHIGVALEQPEFIQDLDSISDVNISAFCDSLGLTPDPVRADQTVSIQWGWGAATPELVEQHMAQAHYNILLDGESLNDYHQYESDVHQNDNDIWVVGWTIPVGTLEAGQHEASVEITWGAPITDGFDAFGPGTENETDGGSCVFTVDEVAGISVESTP
jgi:hypothetical protein